MMFKGFDLLTISFQSPLVLLLRKKSKFLLSLLVGIILFRFVFSNAGFEFPYQDESTGNPTPQRLFVTVKKRVGKVNRIGIKSPFIPPAHHSPFLRQIRWTEEFRFGLLDART